MISIIIPIYNTEKYLEECLSSVKTQTFSDYECLMIDDGSTDSSRKIAEKFLDDSRFKLLNKEHIGFPQAKNIGLDNAKGEYICFIDSDDFVEPQYLESMHKILIDTDSDISSCRYTTKMELTNLFFDNSVNTFEGTEVIIDRLLQNTYLWNKLFKREIFDNMRFDNVIALSDTMLNYKLFERAKRTAYTNYIGYHHRIHDENMTYHVRNFEPTYWPHRLNVYLTMCYYLYSKYDKLKERVRKKFIIEYYFCLHHLTKEQVEEFNQKHEVNILLKNC